MPVIHPQKEQLIAFVQGKLATDESSSVEHHLEVCHECCETLLDLKDDTFIGLLRAARPDNVVMGHASLQTDPGTNASGIADESAHSATMLVQSGEAIGVDEMPAELRDHLRYRIVELIGRGGMGNVYRAEHRLMNRPVALKLINSQLIRQPQAVERFRREVQAAAKLTHPNIVTAYDAEQAGDVHFLVMEFVEGTDLASVVKHRGAMSVVEACECVLQVAEGLQHAYEKGMVHRDIKPHNLMLSAAGQVRILDFGLAGFVTETAIEGSHVRQNVGDTYVAPQSGDGDFEVTAAHLTMAGSVMGTPDYIAPEQARDAHSADIRADIYSLGCTLHFLLTGKPPFVADSLIAKLKAHADVAPESLTKLRSDVPQELSNVVARMMAKKPADRFQTPAAVAAALAPFAKPAIPPPKRRIQTRVTALCLGVAALLAGVIVVQTSQGRVEIQSEVDDVAVIIEREGKQIDVVDTTTGSNIKRLPSGEYEIKLKGNRNDIEIKGSNFKLSRWGKVIVTLNRKPDANPQPPAVQNFAEIRRFEGHSGPVRAITWTPDGKSFLSGSGFPLGDQTLRLWDSTTGREIRQLTGHQGQVFALDINRAGDRALASCGKSIHLWDLKTGQHLRELGGGHLLDSTTVIFSLNGRQALSASHDKTVKLWDLESGTAVREFTGHAGATFGLAVLPGNRQFLSGSWDGTIRLWDLETGETLRTFAGHAAWGLRLLPDGLRFLSAGDDGTIRLWEIGSGKLLRIIRVHDRQVFTLDVSPDGQFVASGGDKLVALWNVETGEQAARATQREFVYGVAFAPDGKSLLSAGGGGWKAENWDNGSDWTIRLWQMPEHTKSGWHSWPADAPRPAIAPFNAEQAKQHQESWAKHLGVPVEYTNSIGMKFRLVPPGEFLMGSTREGIDDALGQVYADDYWQGVAKSEGPQHKVILTVPFYMGVHEVTQSEYAKVMGNNPAHWSANGPGKDDIAGLDTGKHPVEQVSVGDAEEFFRKLSDSEKLLAAVGYRLPTEAQWEFACRAGTTTKYYSGDRDEELARAGWAAETSKGQTHPAGARLANNFGLLDMHGNVWEWCQDGFDAATYKNRPTQGEIDPLRKPADGSEFVIRGGNSNGLAAHCRSAARNKAPGQTQISWLGFRAALPVEAVRTDIKNAARAWKGWPKDAPQPAISPFNAEQAKQHQAAWARHLGVSVEYTNSIGMTFRLIPPGEFTMGSSERESGRNWHEMPRHKVTLTQPFRLGGQHVTVRQFKAFVKATGYVTEAETNGQGSFVRKDGVWGADAKANWKNPGFESTDDHPVVCVSWNDVQAFCAWLSKTESKQYILPTEAQWEYSCRAGSETAFYFGDDAQRLGDFAWYNENGGSTPHPIAEKTPNAWGLSDMHGNVWQWTADFWLPGFDAMASTVDPSGPATGTDHTMRGGDWHLTWEHLRATNRNPGSYTLGNVTLNHGTNKGFRVALVGDLKSKSPTPAVAPFNAEQAKQHQEAWAQHLGMPVEYTNSIGMKFRLIPPGEFLMGGTPEEIESALHVLGKDDYWKASIKSEGPQHPVILTRPIYLGVHEVTQGQYEQVVGKNPSHFTAFGGGKDAVIGRETSNHPVETVSWNDAAEFCAILNVKENLDPLYVRSGETMVLRDGIGYRLPTEAHWEFACRAGTVTKYWSGESDDDLAKAGWFVGNAGGRTHAVGELEANPFGLHDIHGNVWELVQDFWEPNYESLPGGKAAIDPSALFSAGARRVSRGGVWIDPASACRPSTRLAYDPPFRYASIGFRVSLSVDAVRKSREKHPEKIAIQNWKGWPKDSPPPAIAPFNAEQAKQHQEAWSQHLGVPVEYTNSIGMMFRFIPPGEFMMGSSPEEVAEALTFVAQSDHDQACVKSEGPKHKVILTEPLYLGVHEVTQSQFERITGRNPSFMGPMGRAKDQVLGKDTSRRPVEMVSWYDAAEFCENLSHWEKLRPVYARSGETVKLLQGNGYQLPTEAQWEFACRAGTTTRSWIGDRDADTSHAVCLADSAGILEVGKLAGNPFGLHDIHGNVWEWVQDGWGPTYYAHYEPRPAVDPSLPFSGSIERVIRGGVWPPAMSGIRSAYRYADSASGRRHHVGFRVSLPVAAVRQSIEKPIEIPASKNVFQDWRGWPKDAPAPAIAPFDSEQARQHQEVWAKHLGVPVDYTNSLGMKFRLIPPGEFMMGSTQKEIDETLRSLAGDADDQARKGAIRSEMPRHHVILTKPFYLGIHEVTQKVYETIQGKNPSSLSPTGQFQKEVLGLDTSLFPVETVRWSEAVEFCTMLCQREGLAENSYRLPTEAEWEYACRAGTQTRFWFGDSDAEVNLSAWCFPISQQKRTTNVGSLRTNPFSLFDVSGNVAEWCHDWSHADSYRQFENQPAIDPVGPAETTERRLARGGYFFWTARACRSADRTYSTTRDHQWVDIGFRPVLSVEAVYKVIEKPADAAQAVSPRQLP